MYIQIPESIKYAAIFVLYGVSMAFSFLFAGLFIKPLSLKDLEEDAEEDRLALKRLDEENFEYKYLDEYEQLEEKDVPELKDITTTLEIPFLKVTIIMFYEEGVFKYYSNTDVIHKYLNVACRKFVIENDAKKLYIVGKEDIIPEINENENENEKESNSSKSNLFITKPETVLFETKMNRFIRLGSIHDYNDKNNIKLIKEIDILDYLNMNNDMNDSNKRMKLA
jgi:hypothetical protein